MHERERRKDHFNEVWIFYMKCLRLIKSYRNRAVKNAVSPYLWRAKLSLCVHILALLKEECWLLSFSRAKLYPLELYLKTLSFCVQWNFSLKTSLHHTWTDLNTIQDSNLFLVWVIRPIWIHSEDFPRKSETFLRVLFYFILFWESRSLKCDNYYQRWQRLWDESEVIDSRWTEGICSRRHLAPLTLDTVSITHPVIIQLGRAGGPQISSIYETVFANNKKQCLSPADTCLIRIVWGTENS